MQHENFPIYVKNDNLEGRLYVQIDITCARLLIVEQASHQLAADGHTHTHIYTWGFFLVSWSMVCMLLWSNVPVFRALRMASICIISVSTWLMLRPGGAGEDRTGQDTNTPAAAHTT